MKKIVPILKYNPKEGVKSDDQFVQRFYDLDYSVRTDWYGNFPPIRGEYSQWRDFIEDAVNDSAKPSVELILANQMLAAWETYLEIGKVQSFPVSVSINITDVCNARCNFCACLPERVSNQKVSPGQIRDADWLKFCRSFRPNGGGLGEPFAHPRISEVLEYLQINAPHLSIGTVTNGSIMRDNIVDTVASYFSYLYVSVNAARRETYETTMRLMRWNRFIENMKKLQASKEKIGRKRPWMRAGYVVHKHNLLELPELPKILADIGFQDLNVNPMVPPPQYGSDSLLTQQDSIYQTPELANEVFRNLEEACVKYDIALSKALPTLDHLKGLDVEEQSDDQLCKVPNLKSNININSKLRVTNAHKQFKFQLLRKIKPRTNRLPAIPQSNGPSLDDIDLGDVDVNDIPPSSGRSYEWAVFSQDNIKPVCWSPWRALKVDIFDRTLVCCNFFMKLPKSHWTTAKEFHHPRFMWNHPYMQHLRSSMGTKEEVSYCTFCKATDKRHLQNDKIKRIVMQKSQQEYYEICEKAIGFKHRTNLEALEPLSDLTITSSKKPDQQFKPFSHSASYYRNIIFRTRQHNVRRHLLLAENPQTWAPFLADVNQHLVIVSNSQVKLDMTTDILKHLKLTNYEIVHLSNLNFNLWNDQSFSFVWLHGQLFNDVRRDWLLTGLRSILHPKGKMRVSNCLSLGAVLDQLLKDEANIEKYALPVEQGHEYMGEHAIFSQHNLSKLLNNFAFDTDKTDPPITVPMVREKSFLNKLAPSEHQVTELIKNRDFDSLKSLKYLFSRLDRYITFTVNPV